MLQAHLQLRLVAEVVVVQHGGVRLGRHIDEKLLRVQHRQLVHVTATESGIRVMLGSENG